MKNRVIITGGCGFIGHHIVEHFLICTDWDIIVIDKLNYASLGYSRLKDIGAYDDKRVQVFCYDLSIPLSDGLIKELGNIDYIIHMAAETHVDNSIKDPILFVKNNVMSTLYILEYSKTLKNLKSFIYFSTDEVFGPALGNKLYKEWDRHNPTNPYSASKSAAEGICLSYQNTYKIPIRIINVMNAFGERQYMEKFIPNTIKKLLNNETIIIHSYPGNQKAGTRFYIHARNIAAAVLFIIKNGTNGEKYNVTGDKEVSNLEIVQLIAGIMEKEFDYVMVDNVADRPGHDLRYGLDGSKMQSMGWELPVSFEESLKKTVLWTLNRQEWLN
jgi:dTDP-glucose 4,6-dehydratase|uniref:NAD(P)-binding domain-containing protein n=1 Tax=viral metagenome TaxID=1070528 RepID=A0A6C0J211_9ZZZZ